jgi:hypothetical protein
MGIIKLYSEKEEAHWKKLTFPQEDRHLYTSAPWNGGYRWFRSPHVIPIEWYRRPTPAEKDQQAA